MTNASSERRFWLKHLGLAGAAAMSSGLGLTTLIGRALAADATPGMRRLSGSVTVNGQAARPGTLVQPGDTVVTGASAEAVFVVDKNAFLQRGDSRVTFGDNAAAGFLRIISGRLLSVFDHGQRRLETPTAVLGLRGTACYIEAEAERVYFCLCYGEAELTPSVAPQEREVYSTTHHDRPMYIYSDMKMPKMAVPAEVINHSDAELTMLEALVGRRPPYVSISY